MAIRIKAKATTEARFPGELIFWYALDEFDELAVGIVSLTQYLRERQITLLLGPLSVEGIDAPISNRIPWWLFALEDGRQMRQ